MTVSNTNTKSGPFSGNGVLDTWDFDFKIFTASQLEIVITTTATGAETVITDTSLFSIPDADLNNDSGGTVTYPVSGTKVATGKTVTLRRSMAFTQLTNLRNQGGFFPEVHERVFDMLCMGLIELNELVARSVKFPVADSDPDLISTLPIDTLRANKAIIFDSQGNITVSDDDYNDQAAAAAASASAAATSATAAAASATTATTQATNSASSATAAASSAAAAAASAAGMKWRPSVRVATTANITLSGTQTIDGVAVIAGDRVLVKDQSTAANNGIYDCAAGAWSRSSDADTWTELVSAAVIVEEGTANADSFYICTVNQGGTIGVTAVTWSTLTFTIADGSVTAAKLASNAVTTVKITDANVTLAKLANISAARVLGSIAGGTPAELSASQVLDLIGSTRGQILYRGASGWAVLSPGTSGNLLQSGGAGADPSWTAAPSAGWTLGTPTALSGTSVQFTGLPSTVKQVIMNCHQIGASSVAEFLSQIGPSGGVATSGYNTVSLNLNNVVSANSFSNVTTGAAFSTTGVSSRIISGVVTWTLLNASTNLWCGTWIMSSTINGSVEYGSTSVTLSGVLERIRLTTTGGATLNAGSVNIMYQ